MTCEKNDSNNDECNSNSLKVCSPEYAWRYFELHANQRISLFRNFVFILTVYITGIGFLVVKFHDSSYIEEIAAIVLSLTFILVTIIFWLLDARNRHLVHIGEDSLKEYENSSAGNAEHKLFIQENKRSFCGLKHTYCFRILFGIAIAAASLVILSSLFHAFHENEKCMNKTNIIENYYFNQTKNT
jgi:hypothetical protein